MSYISSNYSLATLQRTYIKYNFSLKFFYKHLFYHVYLFAPLSLSDSTHFFNLSHKTFSPPHLVIRSPSLLPFSVTLPSSAYGLRSITSSSFFRLETPFLTFLALLYNTINQLFIHPFYTNRPRFV